MLVCTPSVDQLNLSDIVLEHHEASCRMPPTRSTAGCTVEAIDLLGKNLRKLPRLKGLWHVKHAVSSLGS